MKKAILLSLYIIALYGCTAKKSTSLSGKSYTIETSCPEKTDCLFEILENKSILVKTDDTGHVYYNLEDTIGKTVMKYTSRKITDPTLQDAGYSETLIFETDKGKEFNYTGKDLQKIKMLFNVQCFCRGKAGIYKVEQGSISFKNNKLQIELPELVDSQKTKSVIITLK